MPAKRSRVEVIQESRTAQVEARLAVPVNMGEGSALLETLRKLRDAAGAKKAASTAKTAEDEQLRVVMGKDRKAAVTKEVLLEYLRGNKPEAKAKSSMARPELVALVLANEAGA